jgi:superfamily II DNA helicase RecQ
MSLRGVLILPIEHLPKALPMLKSLAINHKLSRVVFDEGHVLVHWANFRFICMHAKIASSLSVPIVLLSASVPPSMVHQLSAVLGLQFQKILRPLHTWRPNIIYGFHSDVADVVEVVRALLSARPRHTHALVFTLLCCEVGRIQKALSSSCSSALRLLLLLQLSLVLRTPAP